jgi:hypothetical protein
MFAQLECVVDCCGYHLFSLLCYDCFIDYHLFLLLYCYYYCFIKLERVSVKAQANLSIINYLRLRKQFHCIFVYFCVLFVSLRSLIFGCICM